MSGLTCTTQYVYVGFLLYELRCRSCRPNVQATQTLLSRVPETTAEEFQQAVSAASEAYKTWSRSSVLTRQRFVLESVSAVANRRAVPHCCMQASKSSAKTRRCDC